MVICHTMRWSDSHFFFYNGGQNSSCCLCCYSCLWRPFHAKKTFLWQYLELILRKGLYFYETLVFLQESHLLGYLVPTNVCTYFQVTVRANLSNNKVLLDCITDKPTVSILKKIMSLEVVISFFWGQNFLLGG